MPSLNRTRADAMAVVAGEKIYRDDQQKKSDAFADKLLMRDLDMDDGEILAELLRVYDFKEQTLREKVMQRRGPTAETKKRGELTYLAIKADPAQLDERTKLFKI